MPQPIYTYQCSKASCKYIMNTGRPGIHKCPLCGTTMMKQN